MIKESLHQKDIIILSTQRFEMHETIDTELKRETGKSIIIL